MSTETDGPRDRRLTYSAVVIAGIGFFLTRFTVTLAIEGETLAFLFAGVLPLVIGLALSAFGVALTVGSFERSFVRTVTVWCVLGTGAILGLVVLTLLGTQSGMPDPESMRSEALFANVLIGGSVGGTLTGIYAAKQRRQRRAIREQSNRLVMLNRILRDEVINAVMAIDGHAELARETDADVTDRMLTVVEEKSAYIQDTIENVKYLTQTSRESSGNLEPMAVGQCVANAVDSVRTLYPDAEYVVDGDPPDDVTVWANEMLEFAIRSLVENAVEYTDADEPRIEVTTTWSAGSVAIAVADNGPGLPDDQRALLEEGTIAEYDDPTTGFGLNVVRLLVESYNGEVTTAVTDEGTTITLELDRAVGDSPVAETAPTDIRAYGVEPAHLLAASASALVAGGVMGLTMQAFTEVVPVIGALYGVENAVVGWITHEFHSVVFGLVYAGLLTAAPARLTDRAVGRVGLGVAWGGFLGLFAAGFVMPAWLQLVGLPTALPSLTTASLAGHVVWGGTLAVLYPLGQRLVDDREWL